MPKDIKLTYLKAATKFLDKNRNKLSEDQVDALIIKFIKKKFYNVDINIDYKQMQGNLKNIYRIRKADIRVIVKIVDNAIIIEAIIQDIGYRGDIYK
jgi:mRNA interferase RelE/StbE